jgi:hypothetical protein
MVTRGQPRCDLRRAIRVEIAAWERRRNAEKAGIKWMFTVDRARAKLGRVYPPPACRPSQAAA